MPLSWSDVMENMLECDDMTLSRSANEKLSMLHTWVSLWYYYCINQDCQNSILRSILICYHIFSSHFLCVECCKINTVG